MGCDVSEASIIRRLEGHEGNVRSLVAINSSLLASGSDDGTIKIWSMDTWECRRTLAQHIDDISGLITIRDKLVSGSVDGKYSSISCIVLCS